MSELRGKVAIITGGSKGTGLGIAKALIKEGVAVAITGRNEGSLAEAQAELSALVPGLKILTMVADNKDHGTADAVVSKTIETFGHLDILINNAQEFRTGIGVKDLSWDDMLASYESGVFATWRFMSAAYPHLKTTQGTVINMGSGGGTMSIVGNGAYGSNKEAIRGLSRIAAREWGPDGITVNVINPYVKSAESERFEATQPELIAEIVKGIPLRRIGDAELNVGRLCVFLAKAEGKYMTGSTFDVEGGYSMRP